MPNETTPTPAMIDEARRLDGLFAGQCEPHEYKALIEAGLLRFSYEGTAGIMGLAKLRADYEIKATFAR